MAEDEPVDTFYTEERWQNWLDRVREEDLDLEEEDSARLLMNLQEDTAIAVAKVLSAYEEEEIGEDRAIQELQDIQEIVMSEVDVGDEEKQMLVESVQMSLEVVFYSALEFVAGGAAEEGTIEDYVHAAADAEQNEELDAAIGYLVQAGTLIIDGEELDVSLVEEIEYGYVAEWVNGLDSLQSATSDPELVEEDE